MADDKVRLYFDNFHPADNVILVSDFFVDLSVGSGIKAPVNGELAAALEFFRIFFIIGHVNSVPGIHQPLLFTYIEYGCQGDDFILGDKTDKVHGRVEKIDCFFHLFLRLQALRLQQRFPPPRFPFRAVSG